MENQQVKTSGTKAPISERVNEKVMPFSVIKIWDKAIKNKMLYGFESKQKFIHITDLEIYNKLVKK